MARFDVYRHPLAKRRKSVPYLVSIQTDALDYLETRIVAPLVSEKAFGPRIPFLHPIVAFENEKVVVAVGADLPVLVCRVSVSEKDVRRF